MTDWYHQYIIDGKPTTNRPFMNEEIFSQLFPIFPENLKGKVVLDLACNAGFVSFKLAQRGARVYGIDCNESYIDQANYAMEKLSLPRVRFFILDVENIEPSFYNPHLIVALSMVYHLHDPKAFVKKICDVGCDIVTSFRLNLYDHYIKMFTDFGRQVVKEVDYAKKRAALIR